MDKIFDIILVCFVLFCIFILSMMENKFSPRLKKYIIFIFIIVISIILMFRSIGLDLEPHRQMYNQVSVGDFDYSKIFNSRIEPFFLLLMETLKKYSLGFEIFLFISAVIPLYIVTQIILKIEKTNVLKLFCLFLLMYLMNGPVNIIRQFFAASIYLLALYYLSENKKIRFYFLIILCCFIHYSSIILIFIIPLLKKNWTMKKYIFSCIFLGVFCFLCSNFILKIINNLNITQDNYILWKLTYYIIYYDKFGYIYRNVLHKILLFVIETVPIFITIIINGVALQNKKKFTENKYLELLLKSQILGSIIYIIFCSFNAQSLGERFMFTMSIGNFIILNKLILLKENKKNIKYVLSVFIFVFINFVTFLYYAGIHNSNSIFYILS